MTTNRSARARDAGRVAAGGWPAGAGRTALTLPSLDAGRFVAALLVVLFHFQITVHNFTGALPLGMIFRAGHAGVEYFFVLSGFIIFYAHRRDIGRPDRVSGFFWKRAIRILPMLWLTILVWGTLRILLVRETTNGAIGPGTVALDMLLLPHRGPLVLGVTWTLTRELVFYLLFSLWIAHRAAGAVALALWQAGVVLCLVTGPALGPWGTAIFGPHNIGFGIGMLIALAPPLPSRRTAAAAAIAGAAAFVALMAIEWHVGVGSDPDSLPLGPRLSPLLYTSAAGLALAGLASIDEHHVRPERRLVKILGGSSYVLYLVHGLVGSLAVRALVRLPVGPEWLLAVLTLLAIGAAIALHLAVDVPVLRRLRALRRERAAKLALRAG